MERIVWGIRTLRTIRAHWMLRELGLDYQLRPIGSRTGETQTEEFRRLNPREKIPVLQDGGLVLAESAAIVTYLAETYGAGTELIPEAGTPARARYYEWCFFVMTELDATTLYVIRRHDDLRELYGEAPNAIQAARDGFAKQVKVADRCLADGRPHLLGDAFTGADLLLNTCLGWAGYCQIPISDTLQSFLERTSARPAYRAAWAVNFPS
jgi:glutathione S-transferase